MSILKEPTSYITIESEIKINYNTNTSYKTDVNRELKWGNEYIVDTDCMRKVGRELTLKKTTELPRGSSVYFSKSVKFSRMKFRQWARDKDISIVRSPERADIVVVDFTPYNQIIAQMHDALLFRGYINLKGGLHCINNIQDELLENNIVDINDFETGKSIYKGFVNTSTLEELEQFTDIIEYDCKIITTKDLSSLVFTEVMGEDTRDNIISMISSENHENQEIGIEFLSNYSWEDSSIYMMEIFDECSQTIHYSNTFKSVSFAHLRDIFEDYVRHYNVTKSKFWNHYTFLRKYNLEHNLDNETLEQSLKDLVQKGIEKISESVGDLVPIKITDIHVSYTDTNGTTHTFGIE